MSHRRSSNVVCLQDIFIRMIQLCGKSAALTLKLPFQTVPDEGMFPEGWEKVKTVPIDKRSTRIY